VSPLPMVSPSSIVSGSLWWVVSGKNVTKKLEKIPNPYGDYLQGSYSTGHLPGNNGNDPKHDDRKSGLVNTKVSDVGCNHRAHTSLVT
jgi:hypothetical protein